MPNIAASLIASIEEAIKDAAIFGMNDGQMKEKALAEDPSIETLTRWCQARESGKEDAHHLKNANQVKKVRTTKDEADVNKMKAAGRFSRRHNRNKTECERCNTEHEPQRCPSNGKPCFSFGGKNHFAGQMPAPTQRRTRIPTIPMLQTLMNQRRKAQLRILPKELSRLKG